MHSCRFGAFRRPRAPGARPAGADRILYRVVDEYDGDTRTPQRTRSSTRPLSLGELIDLFLGAWPLKDILEMNELDRQEAQAFARPSSEF